MSGDCCTLHGDPCCTPDDCGPCCPDCPTCPTERRRRASEPGHGAQRHDAAWRIPSRTDPNEYGVLVQCGRPSDPYWWLLCPAAATLYVSGVTSGEGSCSDVECLWDDVHSDAAVLYRRLVGGSVTAVEETT